MSVREAIQRIVLVMHGYEYSQPAFQGEFSSDPSRHLKAWEKRITSRITRRLIKNIRGEKGHPHHPEALLPKPAYLIIMDVEEIVDLTPHKMRQNKNQSQSQGR